MSRGTGRKKILDAAVSVIREKGYAATSVEDLCQRAGVTKGAFFHHFRSKDDLAIAAAAHFDEMASALFAAAPCALLPTPRERILGYVALRREMIAGELADYTCLLGTLVQECYATHPGIRAACDTALRANAGSFEPDIAAALSCAGRMGPEWSAAGLSLYIQTVLQGAFVLAKATGSARTARESLGHLLRYLEAILTPETHTAKGDAS